MRKQLSTLAMTLLFYLLALGFFFLAASSFMVADGLNGTANRAFLAATVLAAYFILLPMHQSRRLSTRVRGRK